MSDFITGERSPEGAKTLSYNGRELIQEIACSYKAILASQYITDVLDAIDFGSLVVKLQQSESVGMEARRDLIKAATIQEEVEKLEEKLASGGVAQKDFEFIETEIQKKKDLVVEMKAAASMDVQMQPAQLNAVLAEFLPVVFQKAPDFIYKFCAVMMISNTDLESAYKKGGNQIKKMTEANERWLKFHTPHFEPLNIAAFYLPAVGLEVLKKAGVTLVEEASTLLMAPMEKEEAVEIAVVETSSDPS